MLKQNTSLKAKVLLTISAFALIVSFQNCAGLFEPPSVESENSSTNYVFGDASIITACDTDLMTLYATTYHPFLQKNCAECHTNGPGIGQFGHSNLESSYIAFKSMGRRSINRNAVNMAHQPPNTGPQHQATIDSFTPAFNTAESEYLKCAGDYLNGGGSSTLGKASPAIIAAANNPNTWTTLTWNLATEMADPLLMNKIPLTATIQVRVATIGGVRQGYEFRNPTLQLNTGAVGSYRVMGISLSINKTPIDHITTYRTVDTIIKSTTATNVSPNTAYALAVMSPIANTDTFHLMIAEVKDSAGVNIINPPKK